MTAAGHHPPQPDPGRQPERTRLSWRRTVLAGTVAMLLAVRQGLLTTPPAVAAVTVPLAVAGWLVVVTVGARRITAMRDREPAQVRWPVPALTAVTVALAGLGVLLVAA